CPCPCDPAHNPAARPSNPSLPSSAYSPPFLLSRLLARSSPLSHTDTALSYPPALRSHPMCPLCTDCSATSATPHIPLPCRMNLSNETRTHCRLLICSTALSRCPATAQRNHESACTG